MTDDPKKLARRAGLRAARQDARRARPTELATVIAAYARGWDSHKISVASGVSHQAITGRIRKYEKKYGKINRAPPLKHGRTRHRGRVSFHCDYCHQPNWSTPKTHKGKQFCNKRCLVGWQRLRSLDPTVIEKCISMRANGMTWWEVSKFAEITVQCVQMNIWKYLALAGRLNRAEAERIWNPARNTHYFGWKWIERNTGIICREHGATFEGAEYAYKRNRKWGTLIREEIRPPKEKGATP